MINGFKPKKKKEWALKSAKEIITPLICQEQLAHTEDKILISISDVQELNA